MNRYMLSLIFILININSVPLMAKEYFITSAGNASEVIPKDSFLEMSVSIHKLSTSNWPFSWCSAYVYADNITYITSPIGRRQEKVKSNYIKLFIPCKVTKSLEEKGIRRAIFKGRVKNHPGYHDKRSRLLGISFHEEGFSGR